MASNSGGLAIFDLDGVLIDSKELHFQALNIALGSIDERFVISEKEHITTFDGLSTRKKLEILKERKKLPESKFEEIWSLKQEVTLELFDKLNKDEELIAYMKFLESNELLIAVASNSIRNTVEVVLEKLGVIDYLTTYLSNEDVKNPKPHPEIFWRCMMNLGKMPQETVIFEDSHIGRQAAVSSGAQLIPISNRMDLNWEKIKSVTNRIKKEGLMQKPWKSESMNIVIPMAGAGSRFVEAGYTFPKPLIEVYGKPMIQVVVENLNIEANFIFIVQESHYEKYNLEYLLRLIAPNCKIIQTDGITEGAACTTLLAEEFINNNNPLFIANSDQFVEWNSSETIYAFENSNFDGGIVTFNATHPKWSYVKINEFGFVSEVAEKKIISNKATVGFYYWKKGSDYVKYARQMISKNIRTNGEFYVCPVFNEAIEDNKKFTTKDANAMWGLGTPEDLNYFLENQGK